MELFHKTIVKIICNSVIHDWYAPFRSPYENESIGTGFFINDEGYILTCAHVVEDAINLQITIPSRGKQPYDAEIVSISVDYDIAVIKTNYKNKVYLKIADSDKVKPGDRVNAIGYPLGQNNLKISEGIISGYQDFHFQTDAPINPGNSGGPLVDKDFNVIAINSQKISSDTADNIGYSVPVKHFEILKDSFLPKDKSKIPHIIRIPKLLCKFSPIYDLFQEWYNIESGGYLINDIHENSCLYKAGIRKNDILTKFDKYELDKYGEVDVSWSNEKFNINDVIYRFTVGQTIKIDIFNKEKGKLTVDVTLEYPEFLVEDIHLNLYSNKIDFEILSGLVICNFKRNHLYKHQILQAPLERSIRNKLLDYKDDNFKRFDEKILLVNILPGSYVKSNIQIKSGFFLEKVNDICVKNLEDLRSVIKKLDNEEVIRLSFNENKLVVLSKKNLKEQHMLLSEKYNFNMTPLMSYLIGKYSIPYTLDKNSNNIEDLKLNEYRILYNNINEVLQ